MQRALAISDQHIADSQKQLLKDHYIYQMSTQTLTGAAILGILSAGYFINRKLRHQRKIQVEEKIRQQSIEEIIREIYTHVNTKDNMGVVFDMCALDCQQGDKLLQPYDYTLKTGGKRIRLIMAVVVSEMFIGWAQNDRIPKQVLMVGGLIELLHSASLIIDDIEDGSQQRRGKPCSYLVHGLDRSINAANLMYFLPFKKLYDSISDGRKKLALLQIFMEQMTISHMGQAQDIHVHKLQKPEDLPTLQEYEALTIAKTGSLLRMMVRMLCVVLNRSEQEASKLAEIMNYVGLAFQVTDDVLNLTNHLGKGELAQDLKQKKFTPIINHLRNDRQFMQKFIKNDKSQEEVSWMLQRIKSSDALTQTKVMAGMYKDMAQNLIKDLNTPYESGRFEKMMMFIITRQN